MTDHNTDHHPITQWLDRDGRFGLLKTDTPIKAVRLAVHELAHAMALRLPLLELTPALVTDALLAIPPDLQWRQEMLCRAVEHDVMGSLDMEPDISLERRITHSIRVALAFNESLALGRSVGVKLTPLPSHQSLLLCLEMRDSDEYRAFTRRILGLDTFLRAS